MDFTARTLALTLGALSLVGCDFQAKSPEPDSGAVAPPPVEVPQAPQPVPTGDLPILDAESVAALEAAVAGDWRKRRDRLRDGARHPVETLSFFAVEPDDTVVELWPGQGWYTEILAPYLNSGGGHLIAASFDPERSSFSARTVERFKEQFTTSPEIFGSVDVTVLDQDGGAIAPAGSADVVLTFRNIHNWMAGGWTDKAFSEAYAALKPGGLFGVVEHRLPAGVEQDTTAASGYVSEATVVAFAEQAGFEYIGRSDINANPLDTADHPFGVWTLPPVSHVADDEGNAPEDFDPAAYLEIGESDRMTLLFRKPE